jgi:hypothetical protein
LIQLTHKQRRIAVTESRNWLITYLLVALALPVAGNAFAQSQEGQHREDGNVSAQAEEGQSPEVDQQPEDGAAAPLGPKVATNLTLAKTTIRTETNLFTFNAKFLFFGFAPTTVVCPSAHTAGCTIKVEVSATIFALNPGSVAQVDVNVKGPGQAVDPNSFINIDSTTTGPLASVHTFQWMKRGIPAGSTQAVNVFFTLFGKGSASTGFRTATIQLYLN